MKDPKKMTTEELIALADEIKKGMTKEFLRDIQNIKKADKLIMKKTISKKEAILIADRIKGGMSIKVMNDLTGVKRYVKANFFQRT